MNAFREAYGQNYQGIPVQNGETTNLAEKEPEKAKQLAEAWTKWNQDNVEPKWFPGQAGARKAKAKAKAKAETKIVTQAEMPASLTDNTFNGNGGDDETASVLWGASLTVGFRRF